MAHGDLRKLECRLGKNAATAGKEQTQRGLRLSQRTLVSQSLDFMYTSVLLGFPCGSAGKESTCNEGDLGSISELERSPGEEKGYPLQYSDLENSMDYTVHGVTKSHPPLSDFHFHIYYHRK